MSLNLDIDLAEDFIPEGFFRRDIEVDDHQHPLFGTDKMIDLLSLAKNWFIDATFKIVLQPFTQLLSIHAFIISGNSFEQVPLLFVIKKIFNAVKDLLPSIAVKTITFDFEAAMWQAIRGVLPWVNILGCCFH